MKLTYRIPTEMYAYVEIEAEVGNEALSAEEIAANYRHYQNAFKVGEGIPDKEFNAVVDAMMCAESVKNGTEIWPRMSAEQQAICQAIKKSSKRINSKLKKAEERELA